MSALKIPGLKFDTEVKSVSEFVIDLPKIMSYDYMIVYGMSYKYAGETEVILKKVDKWSEIVEFRCFDEKGEKHGLLMQDEMKIYHLYEENQVDSKHKIDMQEALEITIEKYNNLEIRRYVDYDEDGQAVICVSRCNRLFRRRV